MKRRGIVLGLTVLLAAVAPLGAPTSAAAEGPLIERIRIADEPTPDPFLSTECGFPVVSGATGLLVLRSFPDDDGTGPLQLTTINIGITATAGDNTVTFRDVGADLLRVEPDGTLLLSVIGQIPFVFNGVLKVDPETGEVVLEPQHSTEDEIAQVCEALSA